MIFLHVLFILVSLIILVNASSNNNCVPIQISLNTTTDGPSIYIDLLAACGNIYKINKDQLPSQTFHKGTISYINGKYIYTPPPNLIGEDTFSYSLSSQSSLNDNNIFNTVIIQVFNPTIVSLLAKREETTEPTTTIQLTTSSTTGQNNVTTTQTTTQGATTTQQATTTVNQTATTYSFAATSTLSTYVSTSHSTTGSCEMWWKGCPEDKKFDSTVLAYILGLGIGVPVFLGLSLLIIRQIRIHCRNKKYRQPVPDDSQFPV